MNKRSDGDDVILLESEDASRLFVYIYHCELMWKIVCDANKPTTGFNDSK